MAGDNYFNSDDLWQYALALLRGQTAPQAGAPQLAPNPNPASPNMANPDTLRDFAVDLLHKKALPGLQQTLRTVAAHPIDTTLGATVGAATDAAKSVNQTGWNVLQAVSPVQLPYATDKMVPNPDSLADVPGATLQRLQRIGNALEMGLPDKLQSRVAENMPTEVRATTPEDTVIAWAKATGQTAAMDILPGNELKQLLQGVDEHGQPLTAENIGKTFTSGLLKASLLGNAVAKIRGLGDTVGEVPSQAAETRSSGEILAAKDSGEGWSAAGKEEAVRPPVLRPNDIPEDKLQHFELVNTGIFDKPEARRLITETVQSNAYRQVVESLGPDTLAQNKILGQAIRNGGLGEETITRLSRDYGLSLDETANTVASVLERTSSFHGEGLQVFSEASKNAFHELALKAVKGDAEALRQLQFLKNGQKNAYTEGSRWATLGNSIRTVEDLRRVAMIAQPATAARNAIAQGATFAVNIFEDFASGVYESIAGKVTGENRPIGSYFADAISDVTSFIHRCSPEQRGALEDVLNNVPMTKLRLTDANTWELGSNLFTGGMKSAKAGGGDWLDYTRGFLGSANRLQEMEFRRLFFESRLRGNLERIGVKDFPELMDHLRQEVLPDNIRTAIADAEVHALKQTYAFTPEAGAWKTVLDVYKKAPILTAIAVPFPRFLANQYRYLMERSPSVFFDMFNSEFRDKLMAGAEGGFASREAARALGQATSGAMMLGGAFTLRTSPWAGPKYYQVLDPNRKGPNGEPVYNDMRSWQPFSTYAFLGEVIKKIQSGNHNWNLDPNEWTDALAGVRRISEVPLFAIPDIMRSLKSDDQTTVMKAVATPAGQWLGSFFTPFKALQDLYGGMTEGLDAHGVPIPTGIKEAAKEALVQRDVQGQEFTGPLRANIPGFMTKLGVPESLTEKSLPPRISATTGQPQQSEYPLLRQFFGASLKPMPALDRLIADTPDVGLESMIKNKTPEGRTLVKQELGKILQMPVGNDTFGNKFAEEIMKENLNPDMQSLLVKKFFEDVHKHAVESAQKLDPKAFFEDEIHQKVPGFLRDAVRKGVKESLTNGQ